MRTCVKSDPKIRVLRTYGDTGRVYYIYGRI